MKSGGKRRSGNPSKKEKYSPETMASFVSKRSKLENSNPSSWSPERPVTPLKDIGVSVLPVNEDISPKHTEVSELISVNQFESSSRNQETGIDNHKVVTSDDTFIIRRRKSVKKAICLEEDRFATLSDEIILMIFRWLPRRCLADCALVCHRWQRIVYDESLWYRIDLSGRILRPDTVAYVLQRNPLIMRMSQTEIITPMFKVTRLTMENFTCQLQYLDLSMSFISSSDLAELIGKCRDLRKLSVEHCVTNTSVCSSIANNANLEVLNMSQCYDICALGLEEILINCSELLELNLAWTRLDSNCIDIVCKLVNERITRLNLSGCTKSMNDSHVQELVTRCTCLKDLDLSDCTELTHSSLEQIIDNLCDLQQLSLSRCYSISPPKYIKLRAMKSLVYLNIFGLLTEKQIAALQGSIPEIKINSLKFSLVARPTVGIRRTSIWGLRVRE